MRPKTCPGSLLRVSRDGEKQKSDKTSHINCGKPIIDWQTRVELTDAELRCDRVWQLEREKSCPQKLKPSVKSFRTRIPEWRLPLESPMRQVAFGEGYVISKSKSKVKTTFQSPEHVPAVDSPANLSETPSEPKDLPDLYVPKKVRETINVFNDDLIKQLQRQINDLSLYLEEERLNHQDSIRECEEKLKDTTDTLTTRHTVAMRKMEKEHTASINTLNANHRAEMDTLSEKFAMTEEKLQNDLELLRASFETYKCGLEKELAERVKQKEQEFMKRLLKEKEEACSELRSKLQDEHEEELSKLTKQRKYDIDKLKHEHRKEMDELMNRFMNDAEASQKLKRLTDRVSSLEVDLSELKEQYDAVCSELAAKTNQLTDTKLILAGFERKLLEKIQEVKAQYDKRVESLILENSEIRKLYVKKCSDLFVEKTRLDQTMMDSVNKAKAMYQLAVEARAHANVSLVNDDVAINELLGVAQARPTSAPSTRIESASSKIKSRVTRQTRQKKSVRPQTSLPTETASSKQQKQTLFDGASAENYKTEDSAFEPIPSVLDLLQDLKDSGDITVDDFPVRLK